MPAEHTKPAAEGEQHPPWNLGQKIGLLLGPALCLLIYLFFRPAGLGREGVAALAGTAWIAVWWVTEAVPIPITSLLPVVLFPVLGLGSVGDVVAPYADPTIFLFLGGFIIAVAIERWKLHRRIALAVISRLGTNPPRLVLGFMLATGAISVFISNSATAMMMLPIGLAVINQITELRREDGEAVDTEKSNFPALIMLAIAYAASIGGVGSIIGSPPNAIMVGVAASALGIEISFFDFMLVGIPVFLVFTFIAWRIMLRVMPPGFNDVPGSREFVRQQLAELGPMSNEEWKVLGVFGTTAAAVDHLPVLPEGRGSWHQRRDGGDLRRPAALRHSQQPRQGRVPAGWIGHEADPLGRAPALRRRLLRRGHLPDTGVAEWLSGFLAGLEGAPYFLIVLAVAAMLVFLTEITSNTAIAAIFMPIMASLAAALNVAPTGLMMVAALGATLAFMMPVGTPPNAIAFSTGYVTIRQMIKVGFFLNLASIATITLFGYFWIPLVWGP